MAEDEDDYLSDKFLQQITSNSGNSSTKTYAQRRKEAQRQSEVRNLAGRIKSRKELEKETIDTLKEGMSTSLFEKEKLAEAEGGSQSKAMKMMSKMGFKPGQALGKQEQKTESESSNATVEPASSRTARVAPIPINIWEGRKGLGAMKRPLSPDSVASELERAAKAAKLQEDDKQVDYRSRSKLEYEERRDTGRLASAQKTCSLLDERAGITFNVLCINPLRPSLIPTLLLDALGIDANDDIDDSYHSIHRGKRKDDSERLVDEEVVNESALAKRLRQEMRRDALTSSELRQDYGDDEVQRPMNIESTKKTSNVPDNDAEITDEVTEEAKIFLQLPVKTRLEQVLSYMRRKYHFCFWCGTEYSSKEEMDTTCPGETEEMHD
ncbi:hypothetical protein FRC17_004778 [Serendipita sp. 399]|nr:hypothetical protein FRC17_004778 [Serendipita sp. 399]